MGPFSSTAECQVNEIPSYCQLSKEPRPQGGALKPKLLNPKPRSRNKFGMTKGPEPNRYVMLNLFQHLVCFFLLSAGAPFTPVHRTGFSGAILIKFIRYHVLLSPLLSSKDKDNLLNGICHSIGPFFSYFLFEPVIKGQIFINQKTPHSHLHCL